MRALRQQARAARDSATAAYAPVRSARQATAAATSSSAAATLAALTDPAQAVQDYGAQYESQGVYDDYAQDSLAYGGGAYTGGGSAPLDTGANSRGAVDPQALFDELAFNPGGLSEEVVALLNPIDALRALQARDEAFAKTNELYPNMGHHNNEADAFRHAFWNYRMSQLMGAEEAKKFGDAHERNSGNAQGETLMDLYNNHVGRSLAVDPNHEGLDPATVIQTAIANGSLRTTPFEALAP